MLVELDYVPAKVVIWYLNKNCVNMNPKEEDMDTTLC